MGLPGVAVSPAAIEFGCASDCASTSMSTWSYPEPWDREEGVITDARIEPLAASLVSKLSSKVARSRFGGGDSLTVDVRERAGLRVPGPDLCMVVAGECVVGAGLESVGVEKRRRGLESVEVEKERKWL